MICSLFLISLLLVSPISGKSKFHFYGNLGCPLDCFTYHVEVWEEDFFEKSDDLLTNQTETCSFRPHKYQVSAEDTDDGLDFLRKFEIYMVIYHNCTRTGNMKKFRHDWGNYNIDVHEVNEWKDLDLCDQGEDV
ncbi:hypothetical protein CRE_19886 [Caenorhabditis remanei]|uniref:Uncharacterized protein n=1 Tax=Caenorhabditis remanei TaxID=31234 RepID=E3N2Y7_CAERE|nr:hypothetical protein CRE_19886 [Caenorhabditis remanei]